MPSPHDLSFVITTSMPKQESFVTRDQGLARLEIATLSALFVLIVLGNSAVMLALIASRIKMQRMYYFLLHLSISDLITAFFNVLPQLIWEITVRFYGENFLCKFIKYAQLLGPYLSSYVLVMTAIDRYQAICYPLANCTWTSKRAKCMIAVAWTISLICCIPQAFIFSYMRVPNIQYEYYECWGTFIQPWGERIYVLWYALSVFFVPLTVLIFTYTHITVAIWRNAKQRNRSQIVHRTSLLNTTNSNNCLRKNMRKQQISRNNSLYTVTTNRTTRRGGLYSLCFASRSSVPQSPINSSLNAISGSLSSVRRGSGTCSLTTPRSHANPNRLSKAKIKTIQITVVVIIAYVSCSLPFVLVQLWAHWWPGAQNSTLWTGPLITITMLLPNLNSCVNPWIYLAFNRNLWHTLLHLLLRITPPSAAASTAARRAQSFNTMGADLNSCLDLSTHAPSFLKRTESCSTWSLRSGIKEGRIEEYVHKSHFSVNDDNNNNDHWDKKESGERKNKKQNGDKQLYNQKQSRELTKKNMSTSFSVHCTNERPVQTWNLRRIASS